MDVDSESLPSIQIEVFHKGQYSVSEEPLGVVTIQLDSITIPIQTDNPPYIELWPHLEVTGRMKEISGKVYFAIIHLFFSLAILFTIDWSTPCFQSNILCSRY